MRKKRFKRRYEIVFIQALVCFLMSITVLYVLYLQVTSFYSASISFLSWIFQTSEFSFFQILITAFIDLIIPGILQYQEVKASVLIMGSLVLLTSMLSLRYLINAIWRFSYIPKTDIKMPKYESIDFIQYQLQPLLASKEGKQWSKVEQELIALKYDIKDAGAFGTSNSMICDYENQISDKLIEIKKQIEKDVSFSEVIIQLADIKRLNEQRKHEKRKL